MLKHFLILLFISVAGLFFFTSLQNRLLSDAVTKRSDRLQKVHQNAVDQFARSVDQFAYLMSGMRSYVHQSSNFPTQKELQDFLGFQVDFLEFKDSLVVSFLNTDHEFVYSFSRFELDPNALIGQSVIDLRDSSEIRRLNNLLVSKELKVFPPINLIEGWVGIPLNFSVERDNQVIGYVASIINFKNIIQSVDQIIDTEEFIMKFEVKNGIEFDRERVYDGSNIYHNRIDPFSARTIQPESQWMSSPVSLYGQDFMISTAYRHDKAQNPNLSLVFAALYIFILLFTGFSIYQLQKTKSLNKKLGYLNSQVTAQNAELKALNKTKDKFFSIIGHDLRGPLGSIIFLMGLAQEDKVSNEEIKTVLKQLSPTAKNIVHLLEELLRWAQINNKEIECKPSHVNFEKLVVQNIELLKASASMKRIGIESQIDLPTEILIDQQMMSAVIRNLILNAIKFSQADTMITVKSYVDETNIVLEVNDKGIGMTEETIHSILNSNHTSKEGTDGEKGVGLGLTISKAFIKAHHGELRIFSKEGIGSQFQVFIPQ